MDTANLIYNILPRGISRHWWNRYRRRNAESLDDLKTFSGLDSREQLRRLQNSLFSQMKYFGNREDALPEWREASRINNPSELWKIWPQLPIVDRTTLQNRFLPEDYPARFGLQGMEDATGGSTGEPTHYFHDLAMLRAKAASTLHARFQMGWKPGLDTIIIWGSERDIGKEVGIRNQINNVLFRNHIVDGYGISRQTVERVLDLIDRHRPVSIYGFTSMMEYIARESIAMNACPMKGSVYLAWNGGEMLFPEQSALFQQAFGVPILNLYGGREMSVMACQYKYGGPLHIFRPWVFIELVDENGNPVGPDEPGRIICTSTICRGTPFLRYEIGDFAEYKDANFDESGIRALSHILGRSASIITLKNGKQIHTLYWNHLFKEFSEICQFQVQVEDNERLTLLLKGSGFTKERDNYFRSVLHKFIGDLYVELKWIDTIPLTPQGKLVQVINK